MNRRPWKAVGMLLLAALGARAGAQVLGSEERPEIAEHLLAQADQSRAEAVAGPLAWDPALAAAALDHCQQMADRGGLSHQFPGEASVTDRAGAAGAHFSLIEENVGLASRAEMLHPGWMNSPGHRRNLLNPAVDRVGIAVIRANGIYYAAADYARGVAVLSPQQVEAKVGALLRARGATVTGDNRDARRACVLDNGLPASIVNGQAMYVMRWQGSDLMSLPPALEQELAQRRYRRAAVGNCPAQGVRDSVVVYRVAVVLYRSDPPPTSPGFTQPYN